MSAPLDFDGSRNHECMRHRGLKVLCLISYAHDRSKSFELCILGFRDQSREHP